MLKVSIFHKKGSFSYNNIIKTAEDFKKLGAIETQVGIEKGITSVSNYSLADLSILLIIIILTISIFLHERENETLILIKPNKNGRAPLIISKLTTLIITITVVVAFIYTLIILISNEMYGFGDLNRSIQSISDFRECNIIINIKQYLLLFFILKIITAIIISAIFSIIIQLNKDIMKSSIVIVILVFFSYIFYKFIAFNSVLNAIKYINIFSFLSVGKLIGEYVNINFFAKPVNIFIIYKIISIAILPIIIIANIILFSKEKEIKGRKINIKIISKIKTQINKRTIPSTLFLNEVYKLIIENKIYVVLIVALFIGVSNININEDISYDNDTIIYKNYINKLSGPLYLGKEKYIEREQEILFSISDEMAKNSYLLSKGEITSDEYSKRTLKLEIKEKKSKAFDEVYRQYQYLKMIQNKKNINPHFIDKDIQENIFNLKSELKRGLYLSILLIIILANVFSKEYKSGTIILIQSSKERNKLFLYKYMISFLIVLVLFVLVYLPTYINVINEFGSKFLEAPIQSIEKYMNVSANLTITQFIILEDIFKFIGVICITIIILSLSSLTKNHITTIIISTVLLIPGILIKLIGSGFNEIITFSNIFSLNKSLSIENGVTFNIIYFGCIFILCCIVIYITDKKFKNEELIKREVQA